MIRWMIAAAVAVIAMPAAAQDLPTKPDPAWVGVWQGTIGRYPIVACLDTHWNEGQGRGSYYYLSQLKPIRMRTQEGKTGWFELDRDFENSAHWVFAKVSSDELVGRWSSGERSYTIKLTPVDWQDAEIPYMPCEAPAFMAPRLKGGEVVLEAGDTDGIGFIEHEYRNPEHLDVTVQGFELMGDQPGDAKINAAVANYRPTGTVEDDWVECMSGALAAHGTDGYFDRNVRPSLLSDEYVSVWVAGSVYCGGAHPSHFSNHRLFDRQSGDEIELESWFAETGFTTGEYNITTITPALRDVVMTFASRDPEAAECVGIASESEWWDLALTREGITFKPELPHIVTACEDPIDVPWNTLDPWLGEAGRAGKARLSASAG